MSSRAVIDHFLITPPSAGPLGSQSPPYIAARRPDRRYLYLLTGSVGETATDLSQRLLAQYGGLRGLFRMDIAELARLRGLGDAKSVRLKVALELGRRLAAVSPQPLLRFPYVDDVPANGGQSRLVCVRVQERPLLSAPAVLLPCLA